MTYGDFDTGNDDEDDDITYSLLQHRKKMFKVSQQIKNIACKNNEIDPNRKVGSWGKELICDEYVYAQYQGNMCIVCGDYKTSIASNAQCRCI